MKKIGLVLEGKTAQIFLDKLLNQYHSSNFYTLITQDPNLIPQAYPDNFTFHLFDPTSPSKLLKAFYLDFDSFFIVHHNAKESQIIYEILRDHFPKTPIVFPTKEQSCNQDEYLKEIFTPLVITNTLLTHLPNIPTPIQDIGLGKGEIMEITVPAGSVYCYRTLGSISQKQWKIAGIYRNEELLLGTYSLIIQPNDKLLAIGHPKILSNIYRQITSSLGQFPIPFGKDLYLYLDEDLLSENEILQDLNQALFLHRHLNCNQLIITLLNPQRFELIEHIRSLQDKDINVYLNYADIPLCEVLHSHHHKKIGLAILNHKMFHRFESKKALFELGIPTFKTAQLSIEYCSSSLILLQGDQNIASIILDIASQLHLDFEIYDFDVDQHFHHHDYQSYKNLSQILEKPIQYTQSSTKNPIIYLLELQQPILQFLPFDQTLASDNPLNITSTHLAYHCAHLNKHPQFLIPSTQ